jgi:ATP-dependent RNA helicase RhlE
VRAFALADSALSSSATQREKLMMTFSDLGLSENLLRAIDEKGYTEPSPIQNKAIAPVLEGRDVMAAAQTGTGKTAAFTLPIVELLQGAERAQSRQCRVLIITPTRELAAQVQDSVATYSRYAPVSSAVVFGGVKINPQIAKLNQGVDILVATPGRLLDLHQQGAVNFKALEILVLDEADRMLDMGFIHDIRRVMKLLPQKRQTLMFSATFSGEIRQLAKGFLHNPIEVDVAPPNATADNVEQWVYPVDKSRKPELMSHLIRDNGWEQVLIFTRTKHGANRLSQKLERDGINAAAIHGNKSQAARTKALAGFKQGKVRALVATDIAARGLDISQLPQVVNFDLPNVAEDYVHRIGRTGRAGASGRAFSLVSADEIKQLSGIEKLIRKKLPREEIDGFEVNHNLPETAPAEPRKRTNPGNKQGQRRRGRGGQSQQNNRSRTA